MIDSKKKHIDFIDLAKGLTILLVILYHVNEFMLICRIGTIFRMPLYFLLSGLFFSANINGGWIEVKTFLIKKTNRLLIPFVFFFLVMFPLKRLFFGYMPEFYRNETIFSNPAIWFLLCLFEVNVISYVLCYLGKGKVLLTSIFFVIVGMIGFFLGKNHINLPLYLDTAMTSSPFFCVGYMLRKHTNLLYPNKFDKYNFFLTCVFLLIAYFCFSAKIDNRINLIPNNIFSYYVGGISGSLAVLLLSKMIGKIPFVSYVGKYSIVLLVIHFFVLEFYLIYIEPKIVLSDVIVATMIKFFFVIVVSSLFIPLFKRFIPWFIAQKDLIPIKK